MQRGTRFKPDWVGKIRLLAVKYSNILLWITLTNILQNIRGNEFGLHFFDSFFFMDDFYMMQVFYLIGFRTLYNSKDFKFVNIYAYFIFFLQVYCWSYSKTIFTLTCYRKKWFEGATSFLVKYFSHKNRFKYSFLRDYIDN